MSSPPGALEGRRVRLRPLRPADLELVHDWYEDPELVAPFDRYATETLEGFRASIAAAPGDPASLAPRFVIERSAGGPPVGCVGHYRAHPVLELEEVWYLIAEPSARGGGLGSEAVGLLIDHLFRTTGLERIAASSDVENRASRGLAEKLSLRLEGTLRSALYHHARWHDVAVYAVTRAEWARRPSAPPP